MPVLLAIVVITLGEFALRRTRLFQQAYYVGGNPEAAFLAGINVARVKMGLFILVGALSGTGGVILTSRLMTAVPTVAMGIELRVIAACVIGGASLGGGEGTVIGCVLGVLLMAIVNNAMTLLGISVYWQGTVIGSILITAVMFDVWTRKRGSKMS